ncbi:MAG: type II toxin-antitoxin system HicA family toxin [Methanosarcinaceae archaeon]|nr:type II toxin-antitoxin system HicA family toxin [Methanosarcinaceae archaeon]MDF1533340.1 type II toxin-antitoxin system HicA family toxin [Methanosarcinaceae archaeon]
MNSKLPRVDAKHLIKVVEKLGFELVRQSGSHIIYKNAKGQRLTIPYHTGKILHPKIVRSALKDMNIDIEEFKKLL